MSFVFLKKHFLLLSTLSLYAQEANQSYTFLDKKRIASSLTYLTEELIEAPSKTIYGKKNVEYVCVRIVDVVPILADPYNI